jgi:hypothetical protein
VDSTLYTWRKITERAPEEGCGYFIGPRHLLERELPTADLAWPEASREDAPASLSRHPWVYLYQTFPAGFFPNTEIEIGVIHWHRSPNRFRLCVDGKFPFIPLDLPSSEALAKGALKDDRLVLHHATLDPAEHGGALEHIRCYYNAQRQPSFQTPDRITDLWDDLDKILDEEQRKLPPFNIWLEDGLLKIHLSTRFVIKRKLKPEDIVRLEKVDDCRPLTLTTEAETRRLLRELIGSGAYTISPEAQAAITAALAEVNTLAVPVMPVTDFELVAYTDEEETIRCVRASADADEEGALRFTRGNDYHLRTATYTFKEKFTRGKVHFDEETQRTTTLNHRCELTGQDRFIALVDDAGVEHRFMDRPRMKKDYRGCWFEHPESLLYQIFERPAVLTVAETRPELVAANRARLESFQTVFKP